LLSGEAGIGKTRLLAHFAEDAERQGTLVLRGLCSASEGMPPYLPFLEALGNYLRDAPLTDLRKHLASRAPILAALFPEIVQRLGPGSPAYPLPSEQARFRLYEAIALFLASLGGKQPVLLLIDDLQWADAASLDLIGFLARQQLRMRLLVLIGARLGEAPSPDLTRLLGELDRLSCLVAIEVPPLAVDEVGALAEKHFKSPLEAETRQVLFIQSGGNPFFAEELLRGWQEMGRLHPTPAGWRLVMSAEAEFPSSILRAVEGRMARLPAQTIEYLRSAAVIGRTFEMQMLTQTFGHQMEAVETYLAPALQARLIRTEADGFAFRHDIIREALYQEITPSRRQRLHGMIGQSLENRPQAHNPQRLADVAFHFLRSGDRQRGIRYSMQAAEEALRAYAPKQALHHYRAALRLIEGAESAGLPSPSERGGILLGLGEAALQAGEEMDAVHAFEAALEWLSRNGDEASAARAAHGLGHARWQVEELQSAQQAFELALDLLGEQASAEAARSHADLANLLALSLHRHEAGMAHAQRALEIARQLEDGHLTAAALRALGNLYVRANRLPEGIAHLENALTLATRCGDYSEAAEVCTGLIIALVWSCDFTSVPAKASQLTDFAEHCQADYYTRHVYSLLSFVKTAQGDLAGSQAWAQRAERTVTLLASPEPVAFLHYIRAFSAYYAGDYQEMAVQAMETIEILRTSDPDALFWYLGTGALANLFCGNRAEGRALRDELETLLRTLPTETFAAAEAFNDLALLAHFSGEHGRLLELYPNLLPFRGQFHNSLIDWLLGYIETVRGNWEAAESFLQDAESLARRQGLRWELAQTLIACADLELARGGKGSAMRARASLAEALEIFKSYGNRPQIKHIRARLRDLPRQPGEKPDQPAPAGLSRRELDVLRLLAQGRSNREIAGALALSQKTIANHVTMIFNKIGVENRAAAAAFAAKAGVV
jgi:DNA-binding CsgD family transcriptional regulator